MSPHLPTDDPTGGLVHTHTHDGSTHSHVRATAADTRQAPPLHVHGTLLPEGEVRDIWVVDGRFTFERVEGALTVAVGAWLMPGLVDAHCHVGVPFGEFTGPLTDAEAEEQAITERDAGVLLLRDAGSPTDTRWMAEREDLPEIIRAGRHIARTKRYIRGLADEVEPEALADTVEREAKRGDGWVKLVGDWIDRGRGDLAPLWDRADLKAAIDRAHEHGAKVTAHIFGEEAVADAVDAGIDGVEHGTGITDDVIDAMAERQVALVPTLINIANFPGFAQAGEEKFPAYAAHMRDLHARRYETLQKAREAGVPIYAGTDAGGSVRHGLVGEEVVELGKVGDADFALGAASWRAREWLGRPGIEEGAPADLVVFAEDPRTNLGATREPLLVLLRGRVVSA